MVSAARRFNEIQKFCRVRVAGTGDAARPRPASSARARPQRLDPVAARAAPGLGFN
jgi:hypothetical protein